MQKGVKATGQGTGKLVQVDDTVLKEDVNKLLSLQFSQRYDCCNLFTQHCCNIPTSWNNIVVLTLKTLKINNIVYWCSTSRLC